MPCWWTALLDSASVEIPVPKPELAERAEVHEEQSEPRKRPPRLAQSARRPHRSHTVRYRDDRRLLKSSPVLGFPGTHPPDLRRKRCVICIRIAPGVSGASPRAAHSRRWQL
jgi:hypothetical protein